MSSNANIYKGMRARKYSRSYSSSPHSIHHSSTHLIYRPYQRSILDISCAVTQRLTMASICLFISLLIAGSRAGYTTISVESTTEVETPTPSTEFNQQDDGADADNCKLGKGAQCEGKCSDENKICGHPPPPFSMDCKCIPGPCKAFKGQCTGSCSGKDQCVNVRKPPQLDCRCNGFDPNKDTCKANQGKCTGTCSHFSGPKRTCKDLGKSPKLDCNCAI